MLVQHAIRLRGREKARVLFSTSSRWLVEGPGATDKAHHTHSRPTCNVTLQGRSARTPDAKRGAMQPDCHKKPSGRWIGVLVVKLVDCCQQLLVLQWTLLCCFQQLLQLL